LIWLGLVGISLLLLGLGGLLQWDWMQVPAVLLLLLLALWRLFPAQFQQLGQWLQSSWDQALAWVLLGLAVSLGFRVSGLQALLLRWQEQLGWNGVGALGDAFGAAGQILIAILAAYIAWRQYIISKELTTQQNQITQQQTIDSYFEGISALVLDPQGQLEDWPLERAIAEGRTAAILTGLDPTGKAKILRFLSSANLLSPLRRDDHLGRPILDGKGGYQRDRLRGIRVVNLRSFLEGADLQGTDLRGVDLSDIGLERANLSRCLLSYANLSGSDLRCARLGGASLYKALLYVGTPETASPITPGQVPNFKTGQCAGARIQDADFTDVQGLSPDQRYYLCAWGGTKTRATIPGGCRGIPNCLEAPPPADLSTHTAPASPEDLESTGEDKR
jgi:uncharacterized protein YjbI with pentapeptide repeats